MPLGHAPRKALSVKKVVKKGSGKAEAKKAGSKAEAKKTGSKAEAKKAGSKAEAQEEDMPTAAQEEDMPTALEVFGSDEHVSASPTPPTPCSPRSPTYDRESWWDPVISLTRRMDAVAASMKDLKDRVKCLEEERDKHRAGGSVLDD
jgi:hypothetical protein